MTTNAIDPRWERDAVRHYSRLAPNVNFPADGSAPYCYDCGQDLEWDSQPGDHDACAQESYLATDHGTYDRRPDGTLVLQQPEPFTPPWIERSRAERRQP